MSRSRRKTPVCGITTANTDKQDKRMGNRRLRRKVRTVIRTDPEPEVLPHLREETNPWMMGKDGKWRFDPDRHPAFMRK
ncbi:hypothetical protein [Longimicrobium sp.]|jgi:hypothetical protein|uniref:hypothetical protein n=1 Tax=Longimicrobium sp. TaxID=2029185 RepID=UPI002ED9F4BE